MSLTIASKQWTSAGNKRIMTGQVSFDSSYAFGGETFNPLVMGFQNIEAVKFFDAAGYSFVYDYTNKKVKAYAPAPPIVFEELVTVTANVGTLTYPAAYIMYVSAGNLSFKVIPGVLTPVTRTVAVSTFTAGARPTLTFLAGDTVTSCRVTYVTQAWKDVFDNLVQNATITAGARVSGHASLSFTPGTPDVVSLGELACAIQNITWTDNGVVKAMKALYKGETAATTEATIDFSDTTTKLALLQTDTMDAAADSIYISYVKVPSSGFLSERFVEEDDLTPSGDVVTASAGLGAIGSNMLLFGTCGDLPGPTTAFANLIASSAAVGTTATLVQPTSWANAANTFTFGSNHADSAHVKPSYICGYPWEIQTVPLEIPNGKDMSGVSGRFEIMGY